MGPNLDIYQNAKKCWLIAKPNLACHARLDSHARGFLERQKSTFFDIRVCHPNADSYKDLRQNKCIAFMKTRKKECMKDESWKSTKRPLRY